jgi:ABC-type bacteriocin/lantibiotic exporter with double-glycine peptidase domain
MPRKNNVRWIVRRLASKWMRLAAGLVLAVVSGIVSTIDPLLMRRLIDFDLPQRHTAIALALIAGIGLCLLMRAGFLIWSMDIDYGVQQEFGQELRISMLEQLNRLSAEYHEQTPAGETLSRLESDVEQISELGSEVLSSSIRALVFFALNILIMVRMNVKMTWVLAPMLAAFIWVSARFRGPMQDRADAARAETGRASSVLNEYLSALPQIQLLCAENIVLKKAATVWKGMAQAYRKQRRTELLYAGTVNAVLMLAVFLVLGFGSIQVLRNALTIGGLIAFYTYSVRIFEPLSAIMDLYSRLQKVGASVQRVRAILENTSCVADFGTIVRSRSSISQGIALQSVTYSYTVDRPAIHDLSLHIRPGDSIGIVGPSGSGKTTLARLLVRLSDPQKGEIILDGYPLRDYSLTALRHTISYVPQNPVLFDGSVRENLLHGKPDADDAELKCVIAATQLEPVLQRLPVGMDTKIGPLGLGLSGGERQRIALARALLRKAQVLVLDESTSALDVPTEKLVLESVAEYCRNSILIVISHRLASLKGLDRLVVLNAGEIVTAGSHNLLHAQSPLYRNLYEFDPTAVN